MIKLSVGETQSDELGYNRRVRRRFDPAEPAYTILPSPISFDNDSNLPHRNEFCFPIGLLHAEWPTHQPFQSTRLHVARTFARACDLGCVGRNRAGQLRWCPSRRERERDDDPAELAQASGPTVPDPHELSAEVAGRIEGRAERFGEEGKVDSADSDIDSR
jgi:hypothetical protein